MATRRKATGSGWIPYPDIKEGDWFKTKSTTHTRQGRARPQCFEYSVKPAVGWGCPAHELQIRTDPLPCSTYIGPVHGQPEYYHSACGSVYVTVRVPSFWEPHRFCWVNVSKDKVAYAEKVQDRELLSWQAHGWINFINLDPDR